MTDCSKRSQLGKSECSILSLGRAQTASFMLNVGFFSLKTDKKTAPRWLPWFQKVYLTLPMTTVRDYRSLWCTLNINLLAAIDVSLSVLRLGKLSSHYKWNPIWNLRSGTLPQTLPSSQYYCWRALVQTWISRPSIPWSWGQGFIMIWTREGVLGWWWDSPVHLPHCYNLKCSSLLAKGVYNCKEGPSTGDKLAMAISPW